MDSLRTLKKRRPRQHVRARVSAVPLSKGGQNPFGIHIKKKSKRRIRRGIEKSLRQKATGKNNWSG